MEKNMDKAGVQAAFVAAGLSRLLKDIDDIARPSIRLLTTPVDESTLAIGISKIGGVPDLPGRSRPRGAERRTARHHSGAVRVAAEGPEQRHPQES